MLDRLVVHLKFDLENTIVEGESLKDLAIFFIGILNILATRLLTFRFKYGNNNLWWKFYPKV